MLLMPERTAELSTELIRHARMLHVIRAQMAAWAEPGLEWGAMTVLAHLVKGNASRQGELAEVTMLDPSTVSRHVSQLVKGGHVERQPDPDDGRAVRLAPTDAGRAVFAEVGTRRDAMLRAVLADWDDDDVDTLIRVMRRLNDDFEAYRPSLLPTSRTAQESR